MAPPADFSVDLEALSALQAELNRLVSAIDGLADLPGSVDSRSMGGADVADAVDRFTSRWRAGRRTVVEHLSACEEIAKLAISGYGETDDALRCAVETPPAEVRP